VGGLIAYGLSGHVDAVVLVPFAAGTFIYIALADLLPETTATTDTQQKVIHTLSFTAGLGFLGLLAAVT
jgi:zinc and cadmium transporter